MTSLMFNETVDFFKVKENIADRQQNPQDCEAALHFPVFVKKNIYRRNTSHCDRYDKYPDIKAGSQVLKIRQVFRCLYIPAKEGIFD
jgi:hypothetical protein